MNPAASSSYVFGPSQAQLPNFKVERCASPSYPNVKEPARRIDGVRVRHPLLRSLVAGSPTATKLVGTLTSRQMQADGYITWSPAEEKRLTRYSRHGAAVLAANISVPLLMTSLLALLWSFWDAEKQPRRAKLSFLLLVSGLLCGGTVYACLPKADVVVSRMPAARMSYLHWDVSRALAKKIAEEQNNGKQVDARWVSRQLAEGSDFRRQWSEGFQTNLFTGRPYQNEDSPGNYTIRQTTNDLDYVWYDLEGAENVFLLLVDSPPDRTNGLSGATDRHTNQ